MIYRIDSDPNVQFTDIDDVLNYCINSEYWEDDTDGFDEYLDQDGNIEVAGYEFCCSEVLKELNYDGYQHELRHWAENQAEVYAEDARYDLDHAVPGSELWICDHHIEVIDDEEDGEDTDGDCESVNLQELEERLEQRRQEEQSLLNEQKKVTDDFLSALGIQVI